MNGPACHHGRAGLPALPSGPDGQGRAGTCRDQHNLPAPTCLADRTGGPYHHLPPLLDLYHTIPAARDHNNTRRHRHCYRLFYRLLDAAFFFPLRLPPATIATPHRTATFHNSLDAPRTFCARHFCLSAPLPLDLLKEQWAVNTTAL